MLPYRDNLKSIAQNLRKNATKQENHLWYDFLNKYPIKFRRQKPIDRYIVDFYCEKAKLVIEIDGGQHYSEEGTEKDNERTSVLQSYGLTVLRFTNLDINRNFEGVCVEIDNTVKKLCDIE